MDLWVGLQLRCLAVVPLALDYGWRDLLLEILCRSEACVFPSILVGDEGSFEVLLCVRRFGNRVLGIPVDFDWTG
jgi:hypothetical protein